MRQAVSGSFLQETGSGQKTYGRIATNLKFMIIQTERGDGGREVCRNASITQTRLRRTGASPRSWQRVRRDGRDMPFILSVIEWPVTGPSRRALRWTARWRPAVGREQRGASSSELFADGGGDVISSK